ncbi:MAG: MATE family efflux transporter [Oscillospiraceae bacterium]|nr:MAG: MATE family efflux transporter [Oscillospiraceae bacterium]
MLPSQKIVWKKGGLPVENNSSNLTEGSIGRRLITFAIPYLIANFVQALYGAVDMAVVGWFANSAGISAVSVGSQVMQIVTSMVSGLTMGGTILIAQYFGAKLEKDTKETISTMLTMFAAAGVGFTAVMFLCAPWVLSLLQTPPEAFEQALSYVRIASCGILFIFGYNAISAMLRGLGDSKSPLLFISIACLTNIALDLLMVGGMGMGPAGAALATILSQAVSMCLAILYLTRRDFIFDFKLQSFRMYKDKALKLLKIGLPVSLQESMVSVSFLFIAAIVNSLGVITSAAVGIAGKFTNFAMLPATAFSGAISALTAQNMGAGQPDRAKKSLLIAISMALGCGFFFFLWVQLAPQSVLHIFKADPQVTAAGIAYMRTFSIDYLLVAFVFCMNGFFNGCGRTVFSMANGLFSTLMVRVPLAYFLSRYIPGSLSGIGLAAPLASSTSLIFGLIYLKMGRWKQFQVE